jgi:deoxyribonuclease-4
MVNALHEGERLGLDTVQVFTKNQQQWKAKPLDPAMVKEWGSEVARLGWQGRIVSHASYLINLASVSDELFAKSLDLMTDELERCETLGIPFLVHHPGSHVNWTLEEGLSRIAAGYAELFRRTAGFKTISCLEGTVGSGSNIGGPFEHLAQLRERIAAATGHPERVGFCLDSCHMHAFGYDMSTRESAKAVLADFDRVCGLQNVRVWHLNDSKGKLASRLDRHQHIGEGWIGGGAKAHTGEGEFSEKALRSCGFAEILANPAFASVPKIMETPKDDREDPQGRALDTVNLERLRSLIEQPARAKPGRSPRKPG